jgi:hypothetical protein
MKINYGATLIYSLKIAPKFTAVLAFLSSTGNSFVLMISRKPL